MKKGSTLLAAESTGVSYARKKILGKFSLSWKRGEHWGILGPNGCGKSVLLRLISGDDMADGFEVSYGFSGKKGKGPESEIAVVSMEKQRELLADLDMYVQMRWNSMEDESTPTLSDWLTQDSIEDVRPYEIVNRTKKEIADFAKARAKAIKMTHLEGLLDRRVADLSNGESRRALIARALMSDAKLLLLDAPFLGLDPYSCEIILDCIKDLAKIGRTAIAVTAVQPSDLPPEITDILELPPHGADATIRKPTKADAAARNMASRARAKTAARNKADILSRKGSKVSRPTTARVIERKNGTRAISAATRANAKALIEMRDLRIAYGEKVVFDKFSWTVKRGERWLLAGPNGSGKTTLIALIIGDHLQAYANRVKVFGRQRGEGGGTIFGLKKKIGWVSPELHACMDDGLSALDVVLSGFTDQMYVTGGLGPKKRAAAMDELRRFRLDKVAGEAFGALSSGEQRLVLLARALVKRPPLLILDEPCQNLDSRNRKRFTAMVDAACRGNDTALIYVTHLHDLVPGCITRELLLKPGTEN